MIILIWRVLSKLDFVTGFYLCYIFLGLYLLFLTLLVYFENRKILFEGVYYTKAYDLSIVVPAYNEEENIEKTVVSILESDYPNLKKIVLVDHSSTDRTLEIFKKFEKLDSRVLVVVAPKGTGNAAFAKNYGARFVDTELIGFVDSDSVLTKDAISKIIGYFDNPKVGVSTPLILIKRREKFVEKLQAIEYKLIAISRKLLDFIDAIYVTPGPLAIYRKNVFDKIGGFDVKNQTEDIEITWNIVSHGYTVAMSLNSIVYSYAPSKWKGWFNQRIRWDIGGIQTLIKYKSHFLRKGMLGYFIFPFFLFSSLFGVAGMFIVLYRLVQRIILEYFLVTNSIEAQVALITMKDFSLMPNVLVFFGVLMVLLSAYITVISLLHLKEKNFKKHGILNVLFFMFIYLMMYPPLLVIAIFKMITGRVSSWGGRR